MCKLYFKTVYCHSIGQVLKMLVHMSKAKRVLEIGMFTGYGALSMAEALPENGQLIACELEPYLKDFAQPIFGKSPHGKKITVKTGPAMDTLKVGYPTSSTCQKSHVLPSKEF